MENKIGLSKLSDYEGCSAEVLYFMNLMVPRNHKESHYYYYTLFYIDRGSYKHYKVVEVPVEYAILFPLTAQYLITYGGKLNVEILPEEEIISIEIPPEQEIKRLREVIAPENFEHRFKSKKDGKYMDFTDRIGDQYVFVGESDIGKVIIPCSIIASAFYFTSTRIVRYMFEGDLSKAYKKIYRKGTRFVYYAKPGFSDADIPGIIHFTVDSYARRRLYELSRKFRKSLIYKDISKHIQSQNRKGIYVYAGFPFYGEYEFRVRFHKVGAYVFIDHIIQYGQLPYDKYNIEIVRERFEYSGTEGQETVVEINDPLEVTNMLTTEHPSSSIRGVNHRILYEMALMNDKIRKRVIKVHKEGKSVVFETGEIDKVEGVSTEPATKTTDKKVAKVNPERERRWQSRDVYDLKDFIGLLEKLESILEVSIQEIVEDELPEIKENPQKQDRNRCNKTEYYGADCSARRRYLYAYFEYNGKHVLLVEVDQLLLNPGISTFVLVADKPFGNKRGIAELILRRHLRKVKKEQIKREFMQHFNIYVHYKKHPSKKEDKFEESWCRGIVKVVVKSSS